MPDAKRKVIKLVTINVLVLFALQLCGTSALAQLSLAGFFADSMVFQRNKPLVISGRAKGGAKVLVQFADVSVLQKADRTGHWTVTLPPLDAGGPYTLSVKSKEAILLRDIFIGDVWFCSGQSNMVWKLGWLAHEKANLHEFSNSGIRVLNMPDRMAGKPSPDIPSVQWHSLNPASAANFSAVAIHFARQLHEHVQVPLGIIVSAWGGTDIEPWISPEALSKLDKHKADIEKLSVLTNFEEHNASAKLLQKAWEDSINYFDEGITQKWYLPDTDTAGWVPVQFPALWDNEQWTGNGNRWFRRTFLLDKAETTESLLLLSGNIRHQGEIYINGHLLKGTYNIQRQPFYVVPSAYLLAGKNTIVLKITRLYNSSVGIQPDINALKVQLTQRTFDLSGLWYQKQGYTSFNPTLFNGPNNFPGSLFNAMVHPFTQMPVKGVIWYQGENNTAQPQDYGWHLNALISDWRANWKQPDLPFLIVQLPNFIPTPDRTGNFVAIREAQQKAAELPYVGLVTTIDVGDSLDIHPENKFEVGNRLQLLARKMAYASYNILATGPQLDTIIVSGSKLVLIFNPKSGKINTKDKYGLVKGFEIAGANGLFYKVPCFIEGDHKIVINSGNSSDVHYLRYAWYDNPELGLWNNEGLPLAPFYRILKENSN